MPTPTHPGAEATGRLAVVPVMLTPLRVQTSHARAFLPLPVLLAMAALQAMAGCVAADLEAATREASEVAEAVQVALAVIGKTV